MFFSQKASLLNENLGLYLIIWHQLAGIQKIKKEGFKAVIFKIYLPRS